MSDIEEEREIPLFYAGDPYRDDPIFDTEQDLQNYFIRRAQREEPVPPKLDTHREPEDIICTCGDRGFLFPKVPEYVFGTLPITLHWSSRFQNCLFLP